MSKKSYDEVNVVKRLSKKASINIQSWNKTIEIKKDNTDVGNGSWGKIDYLVKVHGYVYMFVNTIKGKRNTKHDNDENTDFGTKKSIKKEKKLNMAIMSKQAMKKVRTK